MNIKTTLRTVDPVHALAKAADRQAGSCSAKPAHVWRSLPVEDLSITVQCGACGKTEDVTLVGALVN